ncbi:hypothetical protein PIROE2DRAFT_7213 [Piromyces sp. E2]|nr:hypothetical protein PIROE2DRAFT_7213 [Piromyces sp. E2]|eukprot:OUM65715.1 hypothetical protein PIROE2DRAFT_7213 [Piromyces sp. E2]
MELTCFIYSWELFSKNDLPVIIGFGYDKNDNKIALVIDDFPLYKYTESLKLNVNTHYYTTFPSTLFNVVDHVSNFLVQQNLDTIGWVSTKQYQKKLNQTITPLFTNEYKVCYKDIHGLEINYYPMPSIIIIRYRVKTDTEINKNIKEEDDNINNQVDNRKKKTYSNVIVGAVDNNSDLSWSDLPNLSILMSHYHVSKNNFVFFHKISTNETRTTSKFIERVRLIDERIKHLISNYIKHIDTNSPISSLLSKNNVTYNQNWMYTGIINKSKDVEYINFRYFKDAVNAKSKIGTNVYSADLLSRNTYCYIHGNIYPILKVTYILINERMVNGIPMVNFTCKVYFIYINFSADSIQCSTEKLNDNK